MHPPHPPHRRISRRRFLGRAAAASLGTLGLAGRTVGRERQPLGPQNVQVGVDFGSPVPGVPSMSGILHGLNTTVPPDEVIAPLQPNLWRIGNEPTVFSLYDRIVSFGARYVLVLSDTWGYHSPWPYDDFDQWAAHVAQVAQESQGRDVLWDVWNEPNSSMFWQGTTDQFYETYQVAYTTLRDQLGPDAWIGGPSISVYDHGFLAAFLDFCAANGCEVNFLSWHELQSSGPRIYPIQGNLDDAYASFVDNPAYAGVNIAEVHVNEVIGPQDQYRPGEIWGSFYYLEQGGADGACKACWRATDGMSNCSNYTLDGLVTPQTSRLRAGWWAYKLYADGVGTRVQSGGSDQQVVALASAGSANEGAAQVLVGYFDNGHSAAALDVDVTLYNLRALPFLQGTDAIRVCLGQLPDSGEAELPEPVALGEVVVPIADDGSASLTVPGLGLHEGRVLQIVAAGNRGGREPVSAPSLR